MSDLAHTPDGGHNSLRASALWLGLSLALIGSVVAAVNYRWYGVDGLLAAMSAAVLVAIGMFAALWITSLGIGQAAVQYALGSQVARLAIPVAGGLLLQWFVPALEKAGVFPCVLAVYLPSLVIETMLAVRMLGLSAGRVRHG